MKHTLLALLAGCTLSTQALAEEETLPNWQEDTLTGDWGGARANLYKKGIDLGFTHKSDIFANTSGGIKRGTAWLGHTEARLTMDLDKLWGLSGTTAYVHYHSDLGSKFNTNYVGSFAGVDNIEVGTNTAQFYQAWLQKNLLDDHVSLLAGLYAVDSEFYVTDTSALFIQSPYGMGTDFAQSGTNGPPIFPLGALAVRVKLTAMDQQLYLQGALTDGVPGDPNDGTGTHIKLGNGDGSLSLIELGYKPNEVSLAAGKEPAEVFNKTAIGFWRYTSQFDAIDGSRSHNQGAYVLAERTLMLENGHPSQGLAGFVRFGVASDAVNQADWTGAVGLRYHGLITGRDDDIAGVAVTMSHAGDQYRQDQITQGNTPDRLETNIEVTYRAQITPYFAVQPSLQYMMNLNMDSTMKNAWVLGTRFEIAF